MHVQVLAHGDGAWPDIETDKVELQGIARLSGGMQSGRDSVSLRLKLPDGTIAIAQTSLAIFHTAAMSLAAVPGAKF